MTANDLLHAFGKAAGLTGLEFDPAGRAFFEIGDSAIPINIESSADGTTLLATAELGRLDFSSASASTATPSVLLLMNSAFIPLGRGAFSLEGDNGDRIQLMLLFNTASDSEETFLARMNLFVADAQEWKARIQAPDFGLVDEGATEGTPAQSMMMA